MKTTATPIAPTTRHATFRLLAALFFLCLFAPVAMGEGDTYWQDQQSEVADKLVNKDNGKGGEKNPILIASRAEFIYFAKQVNSREPIDLGSGGQIKHDGKGTDSFEGYYFALTSDIDLSEHYWTPIGNVNHPFYGNFDGGGHRVSGLKVKVEAKIEAYVGLFGKTSNGTIQNLGVCLAEEGIQVTTKTESGSAYAGGIAGQALSIRNCYVEGLKTGTAKVIAIAPMEGVCFAGGIVGSLLASSSITHCYATVDVTAEGDYESYAGGIAGQSQGSIFYTYATGAVEATNGDNCAGGICGFAPQKSSLSNNLALNKSIKGDKGWCNRILGVGQATLTSNYASPEMLVNGSVVNGEAGAEADKDVNGDPSITFNNLEKKLGDDWEKNGWTFPADDCLPQLKIRTDDSPSYDNWPSGEGFTPQPTLYTATFLPGSIANDDNHDGLSWETAILIANRAELIYFAKQVNNWAPIVLEKGGGPIEHNGNSGTGFEGYHFSLTSDIDLSAYYWTPIGTEDNPFNGNFDGCGHCVKELKVKIDASDEYVYAGLFGYTQYGTLRNLGIHLAKEGIWAQSTNGSVNAGGLAGWAKQIRNCYVTGEGGVEAQGIRVSSAGGIVGTLTNSLTHCYATVGVKATGAGKNYAGGIAAQLGSRGNSLSYTYATGTVVASGSSENYAGGICGDGGEGNLSNNLALNTSISGSDGKSSRIVGMINNKYGTLSSNYASTKIKLNGSTDITADITASLRNGADTWLETIEKDLIPDDQEPDNGWNTAWEWKQNTTPESPDELLLPQLKITEGENNNPYYIATTLTGQPDIKADSLLTTSKSSPLILGVHIAEGDSVYLLLKEDKWLRNTSGSETPNIPFNGTVKGSGCPVFISDENQILVSDASLIFDGVNLELDEVCLTVNSQRVIWLRGNNVTLANKAGGPAIVNNGQLSISTNATNAPFSILSPDTAIRNTGRLALHSQGIHLAGGASTIFNKEGGSTTYHYPMVEWQFDSNLQDKILEWGSNQFKLPEYATGHSFATTSVTAGTPFGLKAGPSDGSSAPVTQQGQDANGSYTTSFTAKDKSLTVYTDVKDCPRIHLLQPEGGKLTIADANGTSLSDGDYVTTDTQLTLSCSTETNYYLQNYLFGFAADQQSALSGNTVTVGIGDIWLGASLRYEKPTPPTPPTPPVPVFYSIYLPQVEGATTDPAPGEYKVESWDNFRFTLKIDSAYNESQPVVTTSRGETLQLRSIDGSYLVKYVRSDVEIFIDGLIENNPVANEQIAPADALVPKIWAEGSMLCILPPDASPSLPVGIYTLDGRLFASFTSTPGLIRRQLSTGMYIVRVGETVCKVLIR